MSVNSILNSGLQDMQASINRVGIASSRIAGFGLDTDSRDVATSMVELMQGANDAKVAGKVIKTGEELLGTLINLRA